MNQEILTYNFNNFDEKLVRISTINTKGMIRFTISGLISKSILESKERIISSFRYNKLKFPYGRVITNLYPANFKKEGTHYDLPIAMSILINQGIIENPKVHDYLFCGEMDLKGNLLEVHNPIRIIEFCKRNNIKNIILPYGNYLYINNFSDINIFMAKSIRDVIEHFNFNKNLQYQDNTKYLAQETTYDINDIMSQQSLIRALIIAIAGNHSLLIIGPIGSGKTISIKSIKSLFSILEKRESLILSDIYSRYNKNNTYLYYPQIIYPKNDIKIKELFGNDTQLGKISLSNFGIIVFDEFNTFNKTIMDKLLIYLDMGEVYKSNKRKYIQYPINSTFIATMNPCPCGNYGTSSKCNCTAGQIARHNSKISNALLDRIQMKISIEKTKYENTTNFYNIEGIRKRIHDAIKVQKERYNDSEIRNGNLESNLIDRYIEIDDKCSEMLIKLTEKYNLSMRCFQNIIRISRTISDIEGEQKIGINHIYEALKYNV
ncbi:ATP-binding protein [Helcococcus kunzii]|uniref:ATP-binding protein n=1 Tax=Helcococcus kunzii TaxID=40091 RepID=UPI001C9835B6|nr:ATP-binding protein [Helcococcus kunzii]QZO77134.1 ATP-binding protein [Helcococcus kunzii]